MARYRLAPVRELVHQLKLSPVRLRLRQLEGIEHLLDLIEPDKGYPYEFVCFHITGYRPRRSSGHGNPTLQGKHLISDLVAALDELSGHPVLEAAALPEPVWTTEELARRLRVSAKTICRWRRRGLGGRRFRFADGTVRIGFVERCIRRFVRRNLTLVRRGAAFTQLSPAEKKRIVERAREILTQRRARLHEVSQRIAAEVGRAVETVRYTLRQYDRDNPEQALFGRSEQPIVRPEHQALYEAFCRGQSVEHLARRFGRPVDAVEQIVREIRARKLLALPLQYVYSHEFDAPNADELILTDPPPDVPPASPPAPPPAVPRDLPPYLQELYRETVLTPQEEKTLFRRYNYLKFKAARRRTTIDPLRVTEEDLRAVESLIAAAEQVKDRITRANLRLVVSIARRHVGHSPDFLEVVSDGNLSLMRAIEKFDYTRGYKFSTYASWAIMRNYARTIPEARCCGSRLLSGADELLEAVPDRREPQPAATDAEGVRRAIEAGLSQLDERERIVVMRHFGLGREGRSETLDQIGRGFGVTKERVRQIERRALQRLRQIFAEQNLASVLDSG